MRRIVHGLRRRLGAAWSAPIRGSQAVRAATLAKADLTTGMVGEFPELQGVMGHHYARGDEGETVAGAIRDHYAPKGPSDPVPSGPVTVAVALADKLDQLAGFFAIGEKPTGSGDPFALRRAALGVARIVREHDIRMELTPLLELNARSLPAPPSGAEIYRFIKQRVRVNLLSLGLRPDVYDAVDAADRGSNLGWLFRRVRLVAAYLEEGGNGARLVASYKRASNILRIEDAIDGPHTGAVDAAALAAAAESTLFGAVERTGRALDDCVAECREDEMITALGMLAEPLDAFFDGVMVNDADPALRRNRLNLLHQVRATMDRVADFSRIEG